MNELKINSEVATDNDKEEFLSILKNGDANNLKSKYAENYRFFQKKINQFLDEYPSYFAFFPIRILNNCILLPIEAEDQNTALRIFSTLNDRGKPLSDADIFKAQFYKFFEENGKKKEFIDQWKLLEEKCDKMFNPLSGTPLDELFTRYMYYERAKMGIKLSTTEALRKFYEKNKYALLKSETTFENLIDLSEFWQDVYNQNEERFSNDVLKKLFVLNYAPNGMWTYFISVYYLHNRDNKGKLCNEKFYDFLNKTIDFGGYKFDLSQLESMFNNYEFSNGRPITKSMLAWWAFQDENQELIELDKKIEIEHIYAKNRFEKEASLDDAKYVDKLGNKSILEKRINIRASDYRFEDKKKYYCGFTTASGKLKEATEIVSLKQLSNKDDFLQQDILDRNEEIIKAFMNYLKENNLNIN